MAAERRSAGRYWATLGLRTLARSWSARFKGQHGALDRESANHSNADLRPIFIFGFHRAGTTYLQRLLNCSAEVLIWGEHAGILSDYRQAHQRFTAAPVAPVAADSIYSELRDPDRWIPWANKHSAESYTALLRKHLIDLFGVCDGQTRWGTKEIAYDSPEDAAFLLHLFPEARILLLRRNPVDLFLSQFFVKWNEGWSAQGLDTCAEDFIDRYCRRISAFDEIAASTPQATNVDLECLRSESEEFQRMCSAIEISAACFDHRALALADQAIVGSSFVDKGVDANLAEIKVARDRIERLVSASVPEKGRTE